MRARTLAILALSALLSCALVIADLTCGRHTETRPDRLVLPELRSPSGRVVALAWHRADRPHMHVHRDDENGFASPDVQRAFLDQRAVRRVLDSLETLSYARDLTDAVSNTQPDHGLDPPRFSLRVTLANGRLLVLFVGRRLVDTDRVFVARTWTSAEHTEESDRDLLAGVDRVYLVDGHAIRSLDLQVRDLRLRRIMPVISQDILSLEVVIHTDQDTDSEQRRLTISGRPRKLQHSPSGTAGAVDMERWRALTRELAELSMDRFVTPAHTERPTHTEPRTRISIVVRSADGQETRRWHLSDIGACPIADAHHLRLVETNIGTGCVDPARLMPFADAARTPLSLLARAPLSARPTALRIDNMDGEILTIRAIGRAYTWDRDEDIESEAVEGWLDALERSSSGRHILSQEVRAHTGDADELVPTLTIEAIYPDGQTQRVRIFDHPELGRLARRDDEPVFLVLDRDPWAGDITPARAMRFQRRQLLALDPYQLRAVERWRGGVLDTHLVRGELLEEWHAAVPEHRTPQAHAIERLREFARLRARSFEEMSAGPGRGLPRVRVRLRLTFDPGPGQDHAPTHELAIGAKTDEGCLARLDRGPVFTLAADACDIATAPWVE